MARPSVGAPVSNSHLKTRTSPRRSVLVDAHEFCPQSTSTVTWIEEQAGSTTIDGQPNRLAICDARVPVTPQTRPNTCNETAACSNGSGGTGGGFGNPIFGEDG